MANLYEMLLIGSEILLDLEHASNNDNPLPESISPHNREQIEKLDQKIKELETELGNRLRLAFGAMLIPLVVPPLSGAAFAMIPFLPGVLNRLQIVNRLRNTAVALIETFSDQGIIVNCNVEVPEIGTLDLFIRFPNQPKAIFLVSLRSKGKSKVFFREAKEAFYYQRKGSGLRPLNADPFRDLGVQENWLRQNRQDLFGESLRDRKRSAIKILAFAGETSIGTHSDHLYTEIGSEKVLLTKTRVTVYVMEAAQLIAFIQSWLKNLQNPQ
ncbi:MAG: hypothetical protein SFW36_23940 [Leptolyngbyaceae cyanobacterium bins.59]|nr:hypothetical protein [Leptolyngbyaceae cyanobacterium bins.59]